MDEVILKINKFIESYKHHKPNLESNNQYKCIVQVRDFIENNNALPSIVLIDEGLANYFKDFHDLKYILYQYCSDPKIVVLPRAGATRFELYEGYIL